MSLYKRFSNDTRASWIHLMNPAVFLEKRARAHTKRREVQDQPVKRM